MLTMILLLHLLQLHLYLLLVKNIVYFILIEHFSLPFITINFYVFNIRFYHDHIITILVMILVILNMIMNRRFFAHNSLI